MVPVTVFTEVSPDGVFLTVQQNVMGNTSLFGLFTQVEVSGAVTSNSFVLFRLQEQSPNILIDTR